MFARLLALSLGLCAGLAASQAPEFAQQYRQRLGGAIDELRLVVARFDETAKASGLSRGDAITKLTQQPEPLVQGQGTAIGSVVDRLGRLEGQKRDFAEAGPFQRLLVLSREADPGLARATYLEFEPAWPATSEGLVAGGAGFAVAWGVLLIVLGSLRRLWPRRRVRRVQPRLRSA